MSIGPEWGNAHIEVHADTSPMRREMRAAAATAGKEFGKEWGDSANSALGQEMTVLGRKMESQMGALWRRAGVAGATNFSKAFSDGVKKRLNNFDMDIVDAGLTGDWSLFIEQFGSLDKAINGVNAKFDEMRITSNLTTEQMDDLERGFARWVGKVEDSRAAEEFDALYDAAQKLNGEFDKTSTAKAQEEYKGLRRESKALHFEITKMLKAHEDEDRALQRTRDSAHEAAIAFDKTSRSIRGTVHNISILGRFKGARNNFLNIVGSMARIGEQFGDGLISVLNGPKIRDAFAMFTANFQGLGSVFQDQGLLSGMKAFGESFQGALGGLIKGGSKEGLTGAIVGIITGFLQMVQAITMVVLAIGSLNIVAPAITGLVGIVTALAASLSYAMAGFLLPLGPMALAAAGGIGALVIAFADAGDEVEEVTKPFKEFFDAIKEPVQDALFLTLAKDADRFKSVLNNFVGPLLIQSAEALSGVITYMVDAFNRPEVQATLETLGNTLPVILGNLGRGFVDLLTGLLGFFAPISGYTVAISDALAGIAGQFSTWANSTEGQDTIRNFFGEAAASAQILWDLIVQVGGAFSTLFSQAKDTGDQFLQKIVDIVAEFNSWANSPEGRDEIARWMTFAKDLAGKLWDAIETVGAAIRRLDTPENRAALMSLITAFTQILDAVGRVASAVSPLAPAFSAAFRLIGALAISVADLIEDVAGAVESLVRALGRITVPSALRTIADLVNRLGGHAPKFASGGILTGPRHILAGEAGPEAIVPLDRPLNMVDPSVRWMSAIAQGKGGAMGAQGSGGGGRTITVMPGAVQVTAPVRNEALVANMVIDGLVSRVK